MPSGLRSSLPISRRGLLHAASSALALWGLPSAAQPRSPGTDTTPIAVAQVVDMSPNLQDVGRDFLAGSQAAWQSINAAGGLQGRPVRHLSVVTDGSAQGTRDAWLRIEATANCVVLSGGRPVRIKVTNTFLPNGGTAVIKVRSLKLKRRTAAAR